MRSIEPRDDFEEGQSIEPEPEIHPEIEGIVSGHQVLETSEVKAPSTIHPNKLVCLCGSTAVHIAGGIKHCEACNRSWT